MAITHVPYAPKCRQQMVEQARAGQGKFVLIVGVESRGSSTR